LEFEAYELFLGMDWLEHHSPMQRDWLNKRISFVHEGKMITLQGVIPQQICQLTEISGEQLLKLHKGNDLWTLVMLSQVSDEQCAVMELPSQIKDLIHESEGLFKSLDELPPSKTFDHSISLLPGAVPVNCRPYRYPP
jgi:hypothetical protein